MKITGVTPVGGAGGPFSLRFSYPFNANALSGRISVADFTSGPNLTEGTFGVTLDSTAYDNLPNATYPGGSRAGILLVGFYPGDNLAARPRVAEGTQYRVRFTVSGTQQSNLQSQLRLQVNTGRQHLCAEVRGRWLAVRRSAGSASSPRRCCPVSDHPTPVVCMMFTCTRR